jgi:hypothetical protein
MKTKLPVVIAILLALGMPGWAHRLDEYLQATIISIEKDRVQANIRLIPGISVSRIVLASIDRNADGVISVDEQRAYAWRVLHDLSLSLDGQPLTARLVSAHFPKIEEMKDGVGEMQIEFEADLPRRGTKRKLVFENHHLSGISAYLANCLMPRDRDIRVTAQNRNENQSFYAVEYTQRLADIGAASSRLSSAFGGFESVFLLALLLPAALLARAFTARKAVHVASARRL